MLMMAFVFYVLATIVRVWIATSERIKPARTPEKPTWNGLTSQLKSMFGMLFAGGLLTWIWISDAIGDTFYMLTRELFPIYLSDIGNLTVTQIGLLGSAWGIASIVGSFSGGYLTDKRSERTILTGWLIMIAIGVYFLVTKKPAVTQLLGNRINLVGHQCNCNRDELPDFRLRVEMLRIGVLSVYQ